MFLYFFEAKSPGLKQWVSFNSVAERVLLTLFQQSYKGFKKHFFNVRCNRRDPTFLDGFPLYWAENPISRSPGASRTYLLKNGRCAISFLVFKQRLTRWSCSSLSSALRLSRVILVPCLTLLLLIYLHTVLVFLCIVVFLYRHGA